MADNHTLFSLLLLLDSDEQAVWCFAELRKRDAVGNAEFLYSFDAGDDVLWLHAEADCAGDVEQVAEFLQQFMRQFQITTPMGFTWATTCSKPRVGEFGGGGVVITADEMYWLDSHDWVKQKVAELTKS